MANFKTQFASIAEARGYFYRHGFTTDDDSRTDNYVEMYDNKDRVAMIRHRGLLTVEVSVYCLGDDPRDYPSEHMPTTRPMSATEKILTHFLSTVETPPAPPKF